MLKQRSLRLLFIVDGHFPTSGGAEIQALRLAEVLRRRGHRVDFLAPQLPSDEILMPEYQDVPVQRLRVWRIPVVARLSLYLSFVAFLWRHRRDYDAVHVHMVSMLAPAPGWVQRWGGWQQVRSIAKLGGPTEFEGGCFDPRLPAWRGAFARAGLRGLDALQVMSAAIVLGVERFGFAKHQQFFLPNGVDLTRFSDTTETARAAPRIVFAGRLREVKRLDVLLRAAAALQAGGRVFSVEIFGNGTQEEALAELERELGVQQVHWHGYVEDPSRHYRHGDIYVQLSEAEGMPTSVIEAMACALPILVTRISGSEDLVEGSGGGVLVEVGEVEAVVAVLAQWLDHPETGTALGRRSREYVLQQHDLQQVAQRLEHFYDSEKNRKQSRQH